jgi:hypothetical protein|tara:strand:+ start:116 stop:463 length:348 start_codon:yes stop_codon:yes gene_type:complete
MVLILTLTLWATIVFVVYNKIGFNEIYKSYCLWFSKGYWQKRYNVVEAAAWTAKLLVILPAIIFGKEVIWAHFITLMTSALLIWVSEQKLLPTLVAFNSLWIGISSFIIIRYYIG